MRPFVLLFSLCCCRPAWDVIGRHCSFGRCNNSRHNVNVEPGLFLALYTPRVCELVGGYKHAWLSSRMQGKARSSCSNTSIV